MGLNYGAEVTFNGITSLLTYTETYYLVQNLPGGLTDGQADRQVIS
jgi:hypothetical protein